MMQDLTIALIQPLLHWEDVPANLSMLETLINAIDKHIDLIVLPEMFSTGFSMNTTLAEPMNGMTMQWMTGIAAERKAVITGSLILYDGDGEQRRYYNRLVWMQPDGSYQCYDKRHLFSLSDEPVVYTAGTQRLIVSLQGWRICPLICYDLRFPIWSRNNLNAERVADYDVLLYVASWPQRRGLAWNSLLPARAIENLAYAIGVNRVGADGNGVVHDGDSVVIDPVGEVVHKMNQAQSIAVVSLSYDTLVKARRLYPFLRDGDRFQLLS